MTKDEILALPLDKLNELVAEKVMGELYNEYTAQRHQSLQYSQDIAAAWRVQEKMAEKGYTMSLCRLEDGWYCDFRTRRDATPPEYGWFGNQPSAPEAICRAALLAVSEV